MDTKIGTCSICGGAVTMPSVWLGINHPTPTCSGCGAAPKQPQGPTIQMQPRPAPKVDPFKAPFVFTTAEINAMAADNRRYKHPAVTRVGPVGSGSLREFEDEPSKI